MTATITLTMAAPAPAQEDARTGRKETSPASRTVAVTGMIEKPQATTYMYDIHAVTDETSGTRYAPASEEEGLLDRYTGSRVTVFGTAAPEYEGGAVEGGSPLIRVGRVESAGASGEEVTVGFELAIEAAVPPNHSSYVESSAGPGGVICTTDADVLKQVGYLEYRGGGEANEAKPWCP